TFHLALSTTRDEFHLASIVQNLKNHGGPVTRAAAQTNVRVSGLRLKRHQLSASSRRRSTPTQNDDLVSKRPPTFGQTTFFDSIGHGLPTRRVRHHGRCTSNSCRLAATPRSAESAIRGRLSRLLPRRPPGAIRPISGAQGSRSHHPVLVALRQEAQLFGEMGDALAVACLGERVRDVGPPMAALRTEGVE